jgi:integrase
VPPVPPGVPRPVSEEELAAALACASPRVRPWLVLAGWAGLRAVEIARLRRDRILDTAPQPALLIARGATKGRRERLIPASSFVLDELRLAGLPRNGYAFPRHDGAAGPNQPWLISHLANACLREAGSAATLHALRHRFATQLYQATRDIRLVQELLGHSSPSVTAVYAAYDQDGAAAAVEALAAPGRLRAVG